MFLKRKRSNSELSSPMGSSSIFSTQTSCSAQFNSQFTYDITPPHLSSRTRKRIRDNRPAEETIHQNTLQLLFQAQKHAEQQQQFTPAPAIDIPMTAPSPSPSHSRQSSLHTFWALPKPLSRPTSSHLSQAPQPLSPPSPIQAISCTSCDAPLINDDGDAMDVDDVDVSAGYSGFECTQCREPVCHGCAISHLGEQRHCLKCAGQKRWVGGLGWVSV